MRQLAQSKELIESLVSKSENYIIFNDGKAVSQNIEEFIDIDVDEYFNRNDILKKAKSEIESEIESNVPFSSTIIINGDCNLKIIQLSDEQKYLNYNIIVKNGKVNINFINMGFATTIKAKVELLCSKNTDVTVNTYTNATEEISLLSNVYCLENAKFKLYDLSVNEDLVNNQVNVYLLKKNTVVDITNVLLNQSGKKQVYDYHVYHNAIDSLSTLNNYGIAKNTSELILNNNGIVEHGAINSNLTQRSKGIILDMYSIISANPILEINDNDVLAAHGAAIGAIDESDLYYLMSRGLSNEQATSLMISAYVNPFFRESKDEKVNDYINNRLKKYL